jgi:hypothetical protein
MTAEFMLPQPAAGAHSKATPEVRPRQAARVGDIQCRKSTASHEVLDRPVIDLFDHESASAAIVDHRTYSVVAHGQLPKCAHLGVLGWLFAFGMAGVVYSVFPEAPDIHRSAEVQPQLKVADAR